MKSFVLACVAALVIAVIGAVALNEMQVPSATAFATSGVRL